MKKSFIICLLLTVFAGIYAMEFVPALDINGGLTYPTLVTGESTELDKKLGFDAGLAGSFMINTDLLPQLWFIPTLTANYSSTAQPLSVDDQRFLFSRWLDIYLSGGFNYQIDEKWELRIRALIRGDFAQQTADETLANGLYNYIDRGFYFENSNTFGTDTIAEITAGFKYLDKRFPNYQSLASQVDPDTIGGTLNAKAKNEKDNLTYSVYVSCDMQLGNSGWFPSFIFSYDYMPYLEQRIVNTDGSLGERKRIDRLAVLDIVFPYYSNDVSGVNLGYTLSVKTTSQDYYDSMETPDPADDVLTADYYNYLEHTGNFVYTYEFESAFLSSFKPSLSLGLSVDFLAYTERYAKNAEGFYTAAKELDFNYKLFLDFKHKITDFWSYYLNGTFARFSSNMKWDAYGTFNYSMVTITLGTSLSF
jgi:hypothetical protein